MAEEKELVREFSNLTITTNKNRNKLKCSKSSYSRCIYTTESNDMNPNCNFKSQIISAIEANITASGKKFNLKAVDGYYSDIEICLMYGKTGSGAFRSHWGIILQQQGSWRLNYNSRKCLLFHHLGDGIELAVGCLGCLRHRVTEAYGLDKPNLICFDFGRSSAAVRRFLGDTSLGKNVAYHYNNKYRHGEVYYEWRTTNCCRLVFDLLFYLKLDYDIAVKFTRTYTGNEKWDEVFATIVKDYPEFTMNIFRFWIGIKSNEQLKKVHKLLDGQYKLDAALEKYIENLKINCTIL